MTENQHPDDPRRPEDTGGDAVPGEPARQGVEEGAPETGAAGWPDQPSSAGWPDHTPVTGTGHGSSAYTPGADGAVPGPYEQPSYGQPSYGQDAGTQQAGAHGQPQGAYGADAYGAGAQHPGSYEQQGPYGQPTGADGQQQPGAYGANGQPLGGYGAYGQQPGAYVTGAGAPGPASNGLVIAALVCGVIALLLSFMPFIGLVSVLIGAAAIITGVLGLRRGQSKGMSIAGIVTGALGLLISIAVTALTVAAVSAAVQEGGSALSSIGASRSSEANAPHEVELRATVDQGDATVNYWIGGSSSDQDITAEQISVTDSVTGSETLSISVTEDLTDTGSQNVTCEILVDGRSVAKETGTSSAHCNAGYADY